MLSCGWYLPAFPWIAFVVNVATNVILLRTRLCTSIVRSLAGSFVLGCVAFIMASVVCGSALPATERAATVAAAFLTYASASYVFFHLVHIPEASVRIRILQELAARGPLSEPEILQFYDAAKILDIRLGRLTRSGQLTYEDGRYYTGRRRMLYVAKLFRLAKRVMLGAGA
ncbi:MAG: hypothetical protein ACKO9B_05690 [Planctomycetota bacterium]|nr:hypothetical protein [Planctomycetota bacterium]